jgi:hypothetical protein
MFVVQASHRGDRVLAAMNELPPLNADRPATGGDPTITEHGRSCWTGGGMRLCFCSAVPKPRIQYRTALARQRSLSRKCADAPAGNRQDTLPLLQWKSDLRDGLLQLSIVLFEPMIAVAVRQLRIILT